jgi:hypothetical protein
MTNTRPGDGATATALPDDSKPSTNDPTVLLRNEDAVDHVLDVRIADGTAVLVDTSERVASGSQREVVAAAAGAGTLRIEARVDHGAAASITLGLDDLDATPIPEFVVRPASIVVAGL